MASLWNGRRMSSVIRWRIGLRFAVAGASAIVFAGCVGQAVVGEEAPEDGETAGDGDGDEGDEPVDCSGDEAPEQPQPPGPPMNDFSNLAGTVWEGYFEGGSDVTLVLGADGTGTYYVGERRDFDPPTDPDAGYLCDSEDIGGIPCWADFLEGFEYSVKEARLDVRRLQFLVNTIEPWNGWCALQTPLPTTSGCEFSLIPQEYNGWGYTRGEGCYFSNIEDSTTSEPVDCGWANLSILTCECNSEECFAGQSGISSFDLTANEEFTELSNSDGLRLFLVE